MNYRHAFHAGNFADLLKQDLAGFDALRSRLREIGAHALIEARLRPLRDPLRLNGCAMAIFNPPDGLATAAATAAEWIVATLGDSGGEARVQDR